MARDIDLSRGYTPTRRQRAVHIAFTPHPRQGEDPHKNFDPDFYAGLLTGGFRSGKTVCASRQVLNWAVEYQGSKYLVGRLKASELHDSTWGTFRREMEMTGLIENGLVEVQGGNSANQPPRIYIKPFVMNGKSYGGSWITFRHFQTTGGLLGTEPDGIFLDEAAEIPDQVLNVLMGRMSGTPNPDGRIHRMVKLDDGQVVKQSTSGPLRAIFASNPGPSGWLRERFRPPGVEGENYPGFRTFELPTHENKYLPEGYIERMLAQYPEGSALRDAYYHGRWDAFAGQVFTTLDPGVHYTEDVSARDLKNYEFVVGIDFGWRSPTAVVLMAYEPFEEGPIVVLDGYQANQTTAKGHAKRIRDMLASNGLSPHDCIFWGDPAGRNKAQTGSSWIDDFAENGITIGPQEAGRSIGDRDRRLHSLLTQRSDFREGSGLPVIRFCERTVQPIVRDSVLLARYDTEENVVKKGPSEDRLKKDDHFLDALCYGLIGCGVFADPIAEWDDEDPEPMWVGGATVAQLNAHKDWEIRQLRKR